jgi:uncharacterized delta-60 repeat protein
MATTTPFAYNPPKFSIGTGFNSNVYSTKIQSDGKILAGGDFGSFNGITQNRVIRLNSDGSKDLTFDIGSGFNGSVRPIEIQSDGKILVGGAFTRFTGSTQNNLIRLNTDGSKDTTFNIGSGFSGTGISISVVFAIAIQSDGKILVGGQFQTFTGSTQNGLIRLNSDGSKDSTFNIGSGFSGGSESIGKIYSISIQSDGKILAGGDFTTFTGSTQNWLIRLNSDGSKDTTFNIGTGFNGIIYSTEIQSDGNILAGGNFSSFTGGTQNRLIRLNSDGSKDLTFDIGSGFNGSVYSDVVQSDGKILVGGSFTTFTGSTQNGLIRLNSDGSKDTSFNIGSGFNSQVLSTAVQSDEKILAGGGFTTFAGSSQNRLIRLDSNGSNSTGLLPISGTTQVGMLAVGTTQQDYSVRPGEVTWWMGPDEDLGYIITFTVPNNTQPTPIPGVTASVRFSRSTQLTEVSFVNLVNTVYNLGRIYTYNPITELSWPSSSSGYTLYSGSFTDFDDGYTSTPITLPVTFFTNGQSSTSLYVSTNGYFTIGTGSSGILTGPTQANPASMAGNPEDLWLEPGTVNSDGDIQNVYYQTGINAGGYYVKLLIYSGLYAEITTPSSYLINFYRDINYQWLETRVKLNTQGNVGPYNSPSVAQTPSTVSRVFRGDLNGLNWTYLGTGSVDISSQVTTGAEALAIVNENEDWTSYGI